MKTERGVVQGLIRHLKAQGFALAYANDGEEIMKAPNEKLALDTVFSVDESWLGFKSEGNKSHSVYIVLGNSPEEAIADWGYSEGDADGFDKAMEAYSAMLG